MACRVGFTTTVTEQGDMWTFSAGIHGVLGLGTDTDQQMPVWWGEMTKCLVVRLSSQWQQDNNMQHVCQTRGRYGNGVTKITEGWATVTGNQGSD